VFLLATLGPVQVTATDNGLLLTAEGLDLAGSLLSWPVAAMAAKEGGATALDVAVLLELGMAEVTGGNILLPTEQVAAAMADGIGLPTRFTTASPFLLQVEAESQVGRPSFAYRYTWVHGAHPVAVQRQGAYIRHLATHTVYHLDPRTTALVEAMDAFNRTTPENRTPAAAWGAFARVRADAEAVGAELDAHLASNVVVIPSQLAAEVRDHGDGSISFVPSCPELPGDEFANAFLGSRSAQPAYSITRPDGARVRVVVEPRHHAVLERMTRVRRATGDARTRALADPEAVFDGILADVELTFGDRVTGIGAFQFAPEPINPRGGSFMQGLVGDRDASDVAEPGDGAPDVTDAEHSDQPTGDASLPASIVLPRADGAGDATVRFTTTAELSQFRTAAASAHARGEETVQWQGQGLAVEPAALEALGGIGISGRAPARAPVQGRDGRLYLIIYDNDESLREADVSRAAEARSAPAAAAPARVPRALRPDVTLKRHQLEGVRWLDTCRTVKGRRGVLLADDMGLGKTLQVLVHLANVIEGGTLADRPGQGDGPPWRPILIVAPLILVENDTWTMEMATRFVDGGAVFQPVLKLYGSGINAVTVDDGDYDPLGVARLDPAKLMQYRVVITTYETLVNYQHSLARHVGGRPLWSVVVSDEAQRAKSMRTKISVALKAVTPGFHVAATGTPVENRLLDLWNLVDTVQPGLLGTARDFTRTYETPLVETPEVQRATLEALRNELLFGAPHAFLVRRNKAELTDLPVKREQVVDCQMSPEESRRHAAVVRALSRPGVGRQTLALLQELARLSQHPWLGDESVLTRDVEALVGASAKLRATLQLIDEIAARREKVIIFARLVAAQQLLARVISARYGIPVDIINGETKRGGGGRDVRKQLLDRFRHAPGFGAIVLSPFVAGVGLTITEANHVIHYGRWWNPAVEDQATDRAYRIGQSRPVTVYYPVLRDPSGDLPHGTFDEALHTLVLRKREVARDFLHPAPADDAKDAADLRDVLVGAPGLGDDTRQRTRDSGLDASAVASLSVRELAALVAAVERAQGRKVVLLAGEGHAGAQVLSVGREGARALLVRSGGGNVSVSDASAAAIAAGRLHQAVWRPVVVLVGRVSGDANELVAAGVEMCDDASLVAKAQANNVGREAIALELASAPIDLQEVVASLS
jgi:hypothetical protein